MTTRYSAHCNEGDSPHWDYAPVVRRLRRCSPAAAEGFIGRSWPCAGPAGGGAGRGVPVRPGGDQALGAHGRRLPAGPRRDHLLARRGRRRRGLRAPADPAHQAGAPPGVRLLGAGTCAGVGAPVLERLEPLLPLARGRGPPRGQPHGRGGQAQARPGTGQGDPGRGGRRPAARGGVLGGPPGPAALAGAGPGARGRCSR